MANVHQVYENDAFEKEKYTYCIIVQPLGSVSGDVSYDSNDG